MWRGYNIEYITQLLTNPLHYELKPRAPGHPLLFLSFWLRNKTSIIPSTPCFGLGFFFFLVLLFFCIFLYSDELLLLLQLKLLWNLLDSKLLIHLLSERWYTLAPWQGQTSTTNLLSCLLKIMHIIWPLQKMVLISEFPYHHFQNVLTTDYNM